MKLDQQTIECTRMNKEADFESRACGQEKLENKELCRRSSPVEEGGRRNASTVSLQSSGASEEE